MWYVTQSGCDPQVENFWCRVFLRDLLLWESITRWPRSLFQSLFCHFVLLSSMTACIQYVCICVDTCAHMVKETKEGREGLTLMLSHDLHNVHRGTHRRCVFWGRSQSLSKVLIEQGSDARGQICPQTWFFFFTCLFLIFLNSLQTMEMLTEIIGKIFWKF